MTDPALGMEAPRAADPAARVALVLIAVVLAVAAVVVAVRANDGGSAVAPAHEAEAIVERNGDEVVVQWVGAPNDTMRDLFARLERREGELWRPVYRLIAARGEAPPRSISFDAPYEAETIFRSRTSPDRLLLPDRLASGEYRICSETFHQHIDGGGPPRTLCAPLPED